MAKKKSGVIYLVATPIGNIDDISKRAKKILAEADLVLCEDTRVTGLLLSQLQIKASLLSYHEHNEKSRLEEILGRLKASEEIALVSDAGSPLISDPGASLVEMAIKENITIRVLPGANAALTALMGSGLKGGRFAFDGFIPARGKERKRYLKEIGEERRTIILYEAPHRLKKTLADLSLLAGFNNRRISIGRELTKEYEEFLYFTLAEAISYYDQMVPRGEFVLVLEGLEEFEGRAAENEGAKPEQELIDQMIKERLEKNMRLRDIARELAKILNLPANEIYERALFLKGIKMGPLRLDDGEVEILA